MEQLSLPFKLGMNYEELEFGLEVLPDRLKGYDSYLYLGEFNNFLNYITDRIELLFRMDVLEGIIIILPSKELEDVVALLECLLGSHEIVFEHSYNLYKFSTYEKKLLLYIYI